MFSVTYISVVIVAGILFSLSDFSVVLAPASNCYVGKRDTLRPLMMVLVCAGVMLANSLPIGDEFKGMRLVGGCLSTVDYAMIVLSAAAAFGLGRVMCRWPSPVLALSGAVSAHLLLTDGPSLQILGLPLAWIISAVLALLISAVISQVLRYLTSKSNRHYLLQMWILGSVSTFVAAIMFFAIGLNLGTLVKPEGMSGFSWEALLIAVILVCLLSRPFVSRALHHLTVSPFDISPESSLSVIISVALVSLIFTSNFVSGKFNCHATPLSPSVLAFSALAGCRLGRNNAVIQRSEQFRIAVAAIVVPVAGFIFSYFASVALHPDAFDLSSGLFLSLVVASSVLVVVIMGFVIVRFFISFRRSSHALKEAEDCLNENRRAVNVMEIKTMRVENEYLRNHLELQHKEVMSIAMNISEQKEFMEKLYAMVRDAENENDIDKKNEALHKVSAELSLRMNFSNEIDGFYTRVEQLHKDFAVRLQEKYPNLTKQERRLTTLLRLGFSSKYIAVLMNISPKSVEICRHRLRTKLGLGRQENLIGFVKNI